MRPEEGAIPRQISWLLAPEEESVPIWATGELEHVLLHQLDTPLAVDLGDRLLEVDRTLRGSGRFDGLGGMTFRDLLFHPHPPLEALHLLKDYFKGRRSDPEHRLPSEVATVLYYASILVAAMRGGTMISHLNPEALREGADWVLSQAWVKAPLRALFEDGRRHVEEGPLPRTGG